MSDIPLQYINATAAVGKRQPDGKIKFTGSGFVYSVDARECEGDERAYHSFIVTNRHVVAPLARPFVRQSYLPTAERPEWLNVRGDCEKEMWTMHPDDKIDVAVFPLPKPSERASIGPEAFFNDLDVLYPLDMAKAEFIEGSGIFVLGFPLGLVDQDRNYVIARSGIVARILDWYEGVSRAYLIDSLNYPGNSGGPVISHPTDQNERAKFVGMVSAYLPYRDVAVSQQTWEAMTRLTENSGLAIVMPPTAIEETIDLALGRAYIDVGRRNRNENLNGRGKQ